MSEERSLASSDWPGQSCEDLVLQTLPIAQSQMSDFMDDTSADETVQTSYLQMDGAPQDADKRPLLGTSDGRCADDIGTSAVPITHLLPPLADSVIPDCPSITFPESKILIPDQDIRQNKKSPPVKMAVPPCPICHGDFRTLSELKEHFRSHLPPPQDLRCWQSDCPFLAQDWKRFQSHLRREHKLTVVSCSHRSCHLLFPSCQEMSRHLRTHFPFHCNRCDFFSSNSKLFSQHSKSHLHPMDFTVEDTRNPSDLHPLSDDPPRSHDLGNVPPSRIIENGQEHLYKTHMCPECKRCFKKRTHLADHLHLHFPDPNLQCPNCRKFFTSRNKLKIHMMREAGEKAHTCPLCDYSAVEKNALNRHMASIHEDVSNFYSDTYACPVCQETFKLSQALKDHMKGHKMEQKMRCLQQGCDQALSDRKDFLRHLKECHGIQAVECRYHACSLLFKSHEEMELHRKNHYAFHCQDCDFVCSNKHVFRKHKKRGHPGKEELVCHFCPYKSFNPVEYADHVGKMHANEKIHRCRDCDFATAHKRVLMRHMLLHTGEKPHKCGQCDFTCRDLSYLSKHMLTHCTEKNYMCTECGYITKWKHYLSVHMRKHSGDLRYHCNQCSYRCHRADQLSSHKLRHQGKTLICELCGFGCKRKTELQKHMQVKHCQSAQVTMYQCQHCSYQTRYKQTLRNHENGKHTKHREYRCALCPFRTFSNTSLFFHKRKSHGYVPGDQDWLERYATKQQENNSVDLLFPYKMEGPASTTQLPSATVQPENSPSIGNDQPSECMQGDALTDPTGDAGVADESLLAAITLEPVEACSIEMEDFPVRLELSESNELLAKESSAERLVSSEDPLPTRSEILCFPESMAVEEHVNCGQDYEEEADPNMGDDQEKGDNSISVQYSQEAILCEVSDRADELPLHVNASLQLQPGDIPLEVQESWADVVKGGVQLTIVCESSQLHEGNIQEAEAMTVPLDEADDESNKPESILKALRKHDKEQAETLVLEGRVQMLVVQSSAQVYKCEKCSYITKKKGSIVQHAKTGCHLRRSSLVCKECGASFKQQRGLNTHVLKKCPVKHKKNRLCLKTSVPLEGVGPNMDVGGAPADLDSDLRKNVHPIPPQTALNPEETSAALFSFPPDRNSVNETYQIRGGKFHCLFCSYSCSRECTMTCHVTQSCQELQRAPRPTGSQSAAREQQQEHKGLEKSQETWPQSEGSLAEETQDPGQEAEEHGGKTLFGSAGTHRLSCPSCAFTCTQDRAMRTHKKKGCLRPGELQCPLCSFRCMSPGALTRHGELHQKYSQGRVQCKQCSFTCKQPRCMKQHMRICHEGVKPHRCQYCDFSTTRRYRLEAHESLHTGVGRIACNSCSRTFGTNSKLRLHQRRVHDKTPTHFCQLCDYSGYGQNDVARHMGSCHRGEAIFPCPVCQASFSSEAALKQHSLRKHQEKVTHECAQCPFSCHSQATLRCHVQKHHLQLECTVCKETFSRREDLEDHRRTHFSHHCQQCQYAAKDRQQLIHHYAEEHESPSVPGAEAEGGPLRCPFCSFSCLHQLVYDHHVKGHGATRVYKCSDCDYSTRNKQKITWHSRIHTGEKPYKCHLCPYACADPSRLKYHMRIHKDEKNYLCPECGYKCKWVNQLKYHMTKHTGLKPYQCEECDYCTNRADALRVHRETRHRDVRSFICEQCGKAFKTRFLLKTHLKKHSEEKPYICNVCQRGFRWPAGLRHHYLTHTNQQPFFCQYCSYRAKQKFQVVKHLQRHHPNTPDLLKGVGKEPYLFSVQGPDCESGARAEEPP